MREDLYYRLLNYCSKMCRTLNLGIDYIEMTHEIICMGGVDEENFLSLFQKKKSEWLKNKMAVVPLDRIPPRPLTYYRYCRHCDDILPDYEFLIGGIVKPICRKGFNEARPKDTRVRENREEYQKLFQKKDRNGLSDSYIKDILKKNGFSKEEITEDMIEQKRQLLLNKRKKSQLV